MLLSAIPSGKPGVRKERMMLTGELPSATRPPSGCRFHTRCPYAKDICRDYEKLWEASPLKYADRVKTPTLFLHSNEDYRCNMFEGVQMFSALRRLGVTTRLCLLKGENHELSRSGKPKNRIHRLEEITSWMDKYLMEKGE